ncbi:MAG: STAS domain-containing protein [Gammaproteobacteria bacterium]|nr:STAS domain-containing protein [Gammaproteobacteria bacterium]
MKSFELNRQEGLWKLSGHMTAFSLSNAYPAWARSRPKAGAWEIDFSGVELMDSVGLAFVLDSIRYAEGQSLTLSLQHLPKAVCALINAQGVSSLIEPYSPDAVC